MASLFCRPSAKSNSFLNGLLRTFFVSESIDSLEQRQRYGAEDCRALSAQLVDLGTDDKWYTGTTYGPRRSNEASAAVKQKHGWTQASRATTTGLYFVATHADGCTKDLSGVADGRQGCL